MSILKITQTRSRTLDDTAVLVAAAHRWTQYAEVLADHGGLADQTYLPAYAYPRPPAPAPTGTRRRKVPAAEPRYAGAVAAVLATAAPLTLLIHALTQIGGS